MTRGRRRRRRYWIGSVQSTVALALCDPIWLCSVGGGSGKEERTWGRVLAFQLVFFSRVSVCVRMWQWQWQQQNRLSPYSAPRLLAIRRRQAAPSLPQIHNATGSRCVRLHRPTASHPSSSSSVSSLWLIFSILTSCSSLVVLFILCDCARLLSVKSVGCWATGLGCCFHSLMQHAVRRMELVLILVLLTYNQLVTAACNSHY